MDDGHGGLRRAFAKGLFAYRTADGSFARIDTSLVADDGGWRPVAVGYSLSLPTLYRAGATWVLPGLSGVVRSVPR